MARYHDEEWGVPTHDDRELFELLVLEGAQAGLSWRTVLERRDGYRQAFAGFDPVAVAAFGDDDAARLLADPGIVRNRAKVRSAVTNAAAFSRLDAVGRAGHGPRGRLPPPRRPQLNARPSTTSAPLATTKSSGVRRIFSERLPPPTTTSCRVSTAESTQTGMVSGRARG